MKRKFLLTAAMVALFVCLLAVSVSAAAYYYDADGSSTEPIFQCEINEGKVITSYSGSFAKTNANGEALAWYITDTKTLENGDINYTVKSFVTSNSEYCTIQKDGRYMFNKDSGVSKSNIVSINFPNDMGIKSFSDGVSYNFCANTGDYTPDKLKILFAYFPNTWTVTDRIVQATMVLEVYFDPGCAVEEMNDTAFYGCRSLRKVVLPSGLKKTQDGPGTFYGCKSLESIEIAHLPLEHLGNNTFSNCSALTSIVLPETLKKIGGGAFSSTGIVEIRIPNSVTWIGERAFQSCENLIKLYFPANLSNLEQSETYLSHSLQYIYVPNTITVANGSHHFTTVHGGDYAKSIMFFAGTEAEAKALIDLIGNRNNEKFYTTDYSNFIKWDPNVSDDEYVAKAVADKKHYVVYGYSRCEAFFGGHKMSESAEMKLTSYFEAIKFASVCTNDGCDHAGFDEAKTIGAIFADYGYSMTETEIGGKLSMTQFFGINKANLDMYTIATGNAFEYGFVVSSINDPMNAENADLIAAGKTYVTSQDKFAHAYFAVTVVGFVDKGEASNVDKALTFCVYVKDGDKISYLDNGETVETVTMKSYNDVKTLLENKNNTEVTE